MDNQRKISFIFIGVSLLSLVGYLLFDFPFLLLFLFFPLFFRTGRKRNLGFTQSLQPHYCKNCNCQIFPGWTFCPNCSQKLN